MAILYISNIAFPSNCGGGSHIYYIVRGLEKHDEEVYVLTKNPTLPFGEMVLDGIRVINVSWPKTIFKLSPGMNSALITYILTAPSVVKAILEIGKLKREKKIGLIYERLSIPGGIGAIASIVYKLPLIMEMNDVFEADEEKLIYGFLKKINKYVQFKVLNRLIVTDQVLREAVIRQYKFIEKKTEIVSCGADISNFFPMQKDKEMMQKMGFEGKRIIAYVGSLRVYHGLYDLLNAFRIVRKEFDDVALMVIGGGGDIEQKEMSELSYRLRTDEDVVWVGEIGREDLPRYLSIADICVAPYNPFADFFRKKAYKKYGFWGSPVKIFEYMAMGKPVIATDLGIMKELIRDNGILFNAGDVNDLARGISELLKKTNQELEAMGRRGRKIVENEYDWEILAEKTLRIVKQEITHADD